MKSNQSNLSAILSVFNSRLFIILFETVAIFFVYDAYSINIKVDYTIMSIAIIFPLVFSITSAYQRRQDAIALYLEFRNKIIDLTNIFYAVESVKDKNYLFSKGIDEAGDIVSEFEFEWSLKRRF